MNICLVIHYLWVRNITKLTITFHHLGVSVSSLFRCGPIMHDIVGVTQISRSVVLSVVCFDLFRGELQPWERPTCVLLLCCTPSCVLLLEECRHSFEELCSIPYQQLTISSEPYYSTVAYMYIQ